MLKTNLVNDVFTVLDDAVAMLSRADSGKADAAAKKRPSNTSLELSAFETTTATLDVDTKYWTMLLDFLNNLINDYDEYSSIKFNKKGTQLSLAFEDKDCEQAPIILANIRAKAFDVFLKLEKSFTTMTYEMSLESSSSPVAFMALVFSLVSIANKMPRSEEGHREEESTTAGASATGSAPVPPDHVGTIVLVLLQNKPAFDQIVGLTTEGRLDLTADKREALILAGKASKAPVKDESTLREPEQRQQYGASPFFTAHRPIPNAGAGAIPPSSTHYRPRLG